MLNRVSLPLCVWCGLAYGSPHIIHIVADDLGWNDIGFHGSEFIKTPTIDRLAAEGVQLDSFYVNPVCSPTRSALVSGRQTIHTSIYNPLSHDTTDGLNTTCNQPGDNPPCLLLPAVLKELGYATAMIGKWHVGSYNWSWVPQARGFDSFTGYYTGAEDYYTHVSTSGGYDFQQGNQVDWAANGTYSTEIFTQRAVQLIHQHGETRPDVPLYLYLTYQAMHSPLQAPDEWIQKFSHIDNTQRRTVAAMVGMLDQGVANVTEALRAAGMANNSLIIFHTDNGGPANGLNGNMASNMPLKGAKASLHEGGIRGVALVHGAGLAKTGYINHQLIHVSDWYFSLPRLAAQTALQQAKLDELLKGQPPFLLGDGVDVWPAIASNQTSRRSEIIHGAQPTPKHTGVLRMAEWKLVVGQFQSGSNQWYTTPGESFSSGKYSVECGMPPTHSLPGSQHPAEASGSNDCDPTNAACLFNIQLDPCEHNNLAQQQPEVLSKMLKRLALYQSQSVLLEWGNEDKSCLPHALPPPNTGAERPCVGSPP